MTPASHRGSAVLLLALASVALALLFFFIPHTVSADGYVRFQKLDALLREGSVRPDRFSYIGPLFASPIWLFASGSASLLWWCARFNVVVLAAGAAAAWWGLRTTLPPATRATFVLLLAAAGTLPNAARDFYGELFSVAAVGSGLLFVTAAGRRVGWVPVVLGVANMPASGLGLLFVAAVRFWRRRRVDGFVALAAAAALIAAENFASRGDILAAGYAGDRGYVTVLPFSGKSGFSYPMLLGILSLLFSFGKGLFFFSPGLILIPRARRAYPELAEFFELSIAFLAGLLLVYSRWWSWYGGWTWGPRFLLFAAYPSALALALALGAAARPWRRAAIAAIAVWTVWVGVSGAVFDLEGLETCIENRYALEHLCWYVPEYSPLLRHFVLPPGAFAAWQQAWMAFAAVVIAVLITSAPSRTDDVA